MSRFYSSPDNIKEEHIYIKGDEAHHVYKVMRLRPNDKVIVFNGTTREYEGTIIEADRKLIKVEINKINEIPTKRELNVSIAVSLPKRKKMDLIVQKCTELGVKEIIPMRTKRSVISIDKKREEKKITRWSQIAKEAAKQCGRTGIPKLKLLKLYDELLKEAKSYDYVIMPCLTEKNKNLSNFFKSEKIKKKDKILVIIGPEGGFSQDEIDKAEKENFFLVSLGSRILRTETAAIYMMSVLSFYLER